MLAKRPDSISCFLRDWIRSNTTDFEEFPKNLERVSSFFWKTVFIHSKIVITQNDFFVHHNFELRLSELRFEPVHHLHARVLSVPLYPMGCKIDRLDVDVIDSEVCLTVFSNLDISPSEELRHQIRPGDEFWEFNFHQRSVVALLCCWRGGHVCFGLGIRSSAFCRRGLLFVCCYRAPSLNHCISQLLALGETSGASTHLSGGAEGRCSLTPEDARAGSRSKKGHRAYRKRSYSKELHS
mmetsp:Transcript_27761/g.38408  ORF Transcript_27761/g.38408 Transcript_27761/m.38408 type:complete len:239 (-) Transcript_27761:23-739(-)